MRRSNLGQHRGAVLLNMGDFELFDKVTANEGEQHVREAMSANLSRADQLVAKGLLAESVTNALACFQQALRIDPYSYAAHIHSLGMEFVLGHHAELANHIQVFSILYPDDPSPRYLAAVESALSGRQPDATSALEPLQQSMSPDSWNKLVLGYQKISEAAQCFDIDVFLKGDAFDSKKLFQLMNEASALISASLPGAGTETVRLREPHLPCLENGFLDGVHAVQALSSPFYKDISPAVAQVKSSWRLCPEASLPFRAAAVLEARQPPAGSKSVPLLAIQAELFQMAADSSSFLPSLPRTARYLATRAELELIASQPTNVAALRTDSLRNVRVTANAEEVSPAECRAYCAMACDLSDYDSAKRLLDRWEKAVPNDAKVPRRRLDLLIATGNYGAAIQLIDRLLAQAPSDPWLLQQRRVVTEKLKRLFDSIQPEQKTIKIDK
jgi:tetratricopeptide (TPR) repeat protein